MKKLLLGLGAMTAIAAPVVVAVSCGDSDTQTDAQKLASAFRNVISHPVIETGTRMHGTSELDWKSADANIMEETITPNPDGSGEQDTLYEWTFRLPESFGLINEDLATKIETAVDTAEHIQHGFTIGNYDSNPAIAGDDHIEMTIVATTANGQADANWDWNLETPSHMQILNDILAVISKQ